MLDLIRRKQKTLLVKIVFWVIIAAFIGTIFLVWGRGGDSPQDPAATAMTINKDKISLDEVQRSYNNLYNLYQSLYRDQFTPEMERTLGLRQMAADRLIEQTLLVQEAQRRGITVSRDELIASIAEITAFHENGVFSRQRYLEVLAYQRITPEEFERSQTRQLLIGKIIDAIQKDVSVSESDIVAEFRKRNEEINLSFVNFAPAAFENRVAIDESELQAWFSAQRENFRLPEAVSLRYIEFNPQLYFDEVTLDDAALERHYRRNLDQFEVREQISAAHVLIRVSEDADEASVDQARQRAEQALREIRAGMDFAEAARTFSEDDGSAAQGGDLGYFPRGVMVPAFEQVAFSLEPGQISEPVRTPFGFHIIKVTDHIEAGIRPLTEVLDQVQTDLRQEEARQLAIQRAMDAFNQHRHTGDLETAARVNNLEIQETGLFTRDGIIDGIGRAPQIAVAAFSLTGGQLARPAILPDSVYLFKIKERRESRLPDLDEVRAQVEEAYRQEKAAEFARQAATDFLAQLRQDNGDLEQLARQKNLPVQETGRFPKAYESFIPRIGENAALATAAFALETPGSVIPEVFEVDQRFIVAALKEFKPADPSLLDDNLKATLRASLKERKQDEALEAEVEALRRTAEIRITPILANFLER
ncbi:SurA N-terminal domain-containing protein [Geoalkalibacter halelectricus]|uniref:Periplasmic chaperone PpiD n=1 Tax=Geoalkalibacter halelectricus TaxID=2847045 RepID=A0ABY5ZTP7_9BACT|nr:SurA N-terminal domain-containing protein [Geoalkalibacter halelectricus]MDO3376726.1 SurA N-terminal domain-containing protein [Geoalkalibacter halelectricus]UWZ81322.1 SurA N-terminal domain-containing protein [Geoalkalibacter halelectricus]